MGLITNIQLGWAYALDSMKPVQQTQTLATDTKGIPKRYLPYDLKAVSRTRLDIKHWNDALNSSNTEEPKNFELQKIFEDVMLDALLTSQMKNRDRMIYTMDFSLNSASGEKDEEQSKLLKSMSCFRLITDEILNSEKLGVSLIELSLYVDLNGVTQVNVDVIPRTNIVQQKGYFYPDYAEDKFIKYREMKEFGTWILEFNSKHKGYINKAVTHVLMKRFAQSCWSELCEIYGIPPRVMKTDTQNPTLLSRAKQMMTDMGAAAWFIIDKNEQFEWAKGVDTNGDVYKNLINLCSNEISLLVSGAIIGQDTVNGSNSKEQTSQKMLFSLVESDMQLVEEYWNTTVIPALVKLGILKPGTVFAFDPVEDLSELFERVVKLQNTKQFDNEWLNTKFGLQITGEREGTNTEGKNQLNLGQDFFV